MHQKIIDLYDEYVHEGMNRRDFMDRLAQLAGGTAAALSLLPFLENNYALAQTVPENDERLAVERVPYEAAGAKLTGYLVRLKGGQKRPGVIVIHENRGLNPHIQDVARRLGAEGFLTLAVDMLSPLGGTPADSSQVSQMFGQLRLEDTVARLAGTVTFLAGHRESTGKVGVVGFCWGGGYVNRLAAASPALAAGVAYYGSQIPASEVPKIAAPLLLHYAGLDTRINAGIPDYEAALKANNKVYQLYMYEGANHAFNNDTNAARYDKKAADLAWSRTLEFFRKYLAAQSP